MLVKGAWWKVWSYPLSGNENQRFVKLRKTETSFPLQTVTSFTTNVNVFLKRVSRWSEKKRTYSSYHKLQWDIICFRDTGPSNTKAITLRSRRSETRGGRNVPAGSAYRMARKPGTAEETTCTVPRSQESSVNRVLFHRSLYLGYFEFFKPRKSERWVWI